MRAGVGPLVMAATTAEVLAAFPGGGTLLTEPERARARTFRFDQDRDDFVAAHVLARACTAAVVDVPRERLTWSQHCEECGGPHGRPTITEAEGLAVSLSHATGYVAAAVGPQVGVDIEPVARAASADTDGALARLVLSERELRALALAPVAGLAFLRQWVRREALVKLGAVTLDTLTTVDLSQLPFDEPVGGWALHSWERWSLADFRYRGALGAVASSHPPRLATLSSVAARG